MSHSPNIALLIPAAGTSKRMGTPKQLLHWKATTLLGHTIETAQKLHWNETIVVLGANFDRIKLAIEEESVVIVENELWELGLGKSIAVGIHYILEMKPNIDGILILLADQPLIDEPYLRSITDRFIVGARQIIATAYDNQKPGVPALFDSSYFKELSEMDGDKGAKGIMEKYSEHVLTLPAHGKIADIDTEEDYIALYKANHQ